MNQPKKQIVFVCSGNTCRSPMAETILRAILAAHQRKDFTVTSCGVAPVEGEPMNGQAVCALAELGYKPRAHKAKLWKDAFGKSGKLVIAMSQDVKSCLASDHAFTLGELTDGRDVCDPYGGSQELYARTARQLVEMLTRFYRDVLA